MLQQPSPGRGQRSRKIWSAIGLASLLFATACSGSKHGSPAARGHAIVVTPPTPRLADIKPAGTVAASSPEVLSHGSRLRRVVALTFDSNLTTFMQHELDTRRVLSFDDVAAINELIRLHVPATFFLSGLWMQRYSAQTRRLAAVPFFELGSHAFTHRAFAPHCFGLGTLAPEQMVNDIQQSERLLHAFDPRAGDLFRFPGGCFGPAGLAAARKARVRVVQYDVASGDAFGHSVRNIVQHTLSSVRNGSIVVLHITGGNTAPLTPYALPAIVQGLRSRGFSLVTVSQLVSQR